ncbi:MAG: hypothetical protein BroJett013_07410 [Alphaproteobacteria bacterium]|nr:MAG: hypothetical protein BroJett013_07410 [Alphaproteobacteria bacterium]
MIGIRRKPLDAITQEVVISLSDEPDRWRGFLVDPGNRRLKTVTLERDDGLLVTLKDSLATPWRTARLRVLAPGLGRYDPQGQDLRAMLGAFDGWLKSAPARSEANVRAFLARAPQPR